MSRPPRHRPEEGVRRLALICALMLSSACSTTLDPTLAGSVPALNVGGSAGASSMANAGEGPVAGPTIKPGSLSDCALFALVDHQYFACSTLRTFAEASADCAEANASLVKVDGSEETALLQSLSFPGHERGWIGASRNATFDWSWADGTPFWHGDAQGMAEPGAYTYWHAGEPDNSSDTVRKEEACATFDAGLGTWLDRYCDLVLPYVCELTPAGSAAGGK